MESDPVAGTVASSAGQSRAVMVAALLSGYAQGAEGTAHRCEARGDVYGQTLARSRAQVYREAAELVRTMALADAAAEMIRRATQASVRTPPLIDFDAAGVRYLTVRAWQFCAWQIDPALPEVAPSWGR
jgi:hypothetical protein